MNNFRYKFEADENCVFMHHSGVLTASEMYARSKLVTDDKKYRKGVNKFTDLRNCELQLNFNDIEGLASYISSQTKTRGEYVEILLVSGSLGYGMARMLDSLLDIPSVHYHILKSTDDKLLQKIRTIMGLSAGFDLEKCLQALSSN
jgi:hypothetical protein